MIELDIEAFDEELDELNSDIERLLDANETNIPQSQKDSNIEKISEFRESYFTMLDDRGLKETDLDTLISEHNKERAAEVAYDDRVAKEQSDNAEWDAEYQQAIQDYQDIVARIADLEGKIEEYEERKSLEEWNSD